MRGLYNCVICAIYLYLEQTTMDHKDMEGPQPCGVKSTMVGNKQHKQQKQIIGLKKRQTNIFQSQRIPV